MNYDLVSLLLLAAGVIGAIWPANGRVAWALVGVVGLLGVR